MSSTMNTTAKRNRGFTLIEVLVAVLVLSIGLLGLAALQASGLRNNYNAYASSQAVILANDMTDRIRANPTEAANGLYNNITAAAADPGCMTGNCSTTQIRDHDTAVWYADLQNTLPGGTGTVTGNGTVFTVSVMWDEARNGGVGAGCGAAVAATPGCFSTTFIP